MERDFVAWLRQRLAGHPQLRLGVGDDAALLRLSEGDDAVVTSDLLCDGVHFILSETEPERIGRKALAASLSDLAAMASRPVASCVDLLLPRSGASRLARQLIEGMLPLAERYQVAIAGGDTNTWDGPLVVSVAAIGEVRAEGAWRRSGAKPGDMLLVTGELGGSLEGHHLDFEPRVEEALTLAGKVAVHAGMDLSDGLATDLPRLLEASGCGAEIVLTALPIRQSLRQRLRGDHGRAAEHALTDGEDFELLLAVAPEDADWLLSEQPLNVPLTAIGRCLETAGIWLIDAKGERRPLESRGFEHQES